MAEADTEAQEDELLALESIFNDSDVFTCAKSNEDSICSEGMFFAHLDLPQAFEIFTTHKEGKKHNKVKFLPPVVLNFQIPEDYPSTNPPKFSVSCKWLRTDQLSKICQKLDEVWEENKGDVILFLWTNFLKEESFDFLELHSPLDLNNVVHRHINVKQKNCEHDSLNSSSTDNPTALDPRGFQDIGAQELLLPAILEHNENQLEKEFHSTLYTCEVCFQEKLGSLCTRFFKCDHVFCKECMASYFEIHIKDGSVKCLSCPSDKCESQAHPGQVKELVSEELFSRYDRLLLQYSLDTMSDIVYCPRKACGCAVMIDNDNYMGTCPKCQFAFCTFCKHTYHGVSPCKVQSSEIKEVKKIYLEAGPEEKQIMEKRYGKRTIQKWIEESNSEIWLVSNCKKCPYCKTNIEKSDGCNKMTCTKCRTYFCWLCLHVLPPGNPYSHFKSTLSPCFDRLFDGMIQDDDFDGDEYFDDDEDLDFF